MSREYDRENFLKTGIYGITAEILSKGRSNTEIVEAMIEGGIRFIQYREKEKSARERYEECLVLRALTKKAGVSFVIDDFVDLALAVDADGVHIGQTDLPPAIVRSLLGNDKIIGLSTHGEADLEAANKLVDIIDYIGTGPVYETQTKKNVSPAGLAYIRQAAAFSKLPFVAIGGIKKENIHEVAAAGAKTAAVVSAITGAVNVVEEIRILRQLLVDKK